VECLKPITILDPRLTFCPLLVIAFRNTLLGTPIANSICVAASPKRNPILCYDNFLRKGRTFLMMISAPHVKRASSLAFTRYFRLSLPSYCRGSLLLHSFDGV